jgi:hypothetical protein
MLDAHPDLAMAPESHFIPGLIQEEDRYLSSGVLDHRTLVSNLGNVEEFKRLDLDIGRLVQELDRRPVPSMADFVRFIFRSYASKHGKRRYGDKTPRYVLHLPLIADAFPEARFVHLIRDGRDIALSMLARRVDWMWKDVHECAVNWRRRVERGREAGAALGSRYLEVRYEALVERPNEVLECISDFAHLPFDKAMLDFRGLGSGGRTHENTTRPVTPKLRDWRTEMKRSDVIVFERIAGRALDSHGYERLGPPYPLPARMRADLHFAYLKGRRILKEVLPVSAR